MLGAGRGRVRLVHIHRVGVKDAAVIRSFTVRYPGAQVDLRGKNAPRHDARARIGGARKAWTCVENQKRAILRNLAGEETATRTGPDNNDIVSVVGSHYSDRL